MLSIVIENISKTEQAPPPRADMPRGIYHKDKPVPKQRSAPEETTEPESETKYDHRSNPALRLMMANLRRFGWVLGGMVLLLLGSIFVIRMIWSFNDRRLQREALPPLPAAEAASIPAAQPTPAAMNTAVDLNTEVIRRAVFLAKHAEVLDRGGKIEEAIAKYREALDLWPYLASGWANLGRLFLRSRDFARAQVAIEKAVENNPGEADLLNDLGVAYLYLGKIDKAVPLFDAAMEIDPAYSPSLFNLALSQMSRGDRGTARDTLQRYLRIKPDDPRALREAAFIDALEKRYDEAIGYLERALSRAPDWPLLYFDAAAVAALMGRPDEAVRYLEKAEPMTDPATVYQLYQEPAFREIRLTELGKLFEAELAQRARERAADAAPNKSVEVHVPSEPVLSTGRDR